MRRAVLVVLGLVLLIAAVAKLAALSGPVDTLGWPREMIVAGAGVEILLGLWFVSGFAVSTAHVAALATFVLFSALSLYQVIRGVPSCGCLGKIYVHPAWMLTFDLVVVAALTALWVSTRENGRTSGSGNAKHVTLPNALAVGLISAFSFLLLVGAAGWGLAGSWDGALGVASGRDVVISPEVVDVGGGLIGETKTATVRLVNGSATPVRVVGGKNSCGCLVTGDLPVTLPAYGSVEFPIAVTIKSAGYQEVIFRFFTDHQDHRTLSGRVRYEATSRMSPEAIATAP